MHQTELVDAIITMTHVLEPQALATLHQRLTKMLGNDMYGSHQSGGGAPSSFRGGGPRDHHHNHHNHHHNQMQFHHQHQHRGRGGGGFSEGYMPDRRRFNDYRDAAGNNTNGNGMRYSSRGGYGGGGGRHRGSGRFRNDDHTASSGHRNHDNGDDNRKWRSEEGGAKNANAANSVSGGGSNANNSTGGANTTNVAGEGERPHQRKGENKRRDKRRPNTTEGEGK
ncbi:hypothetical protein LSM04_002439 [Trypanosoma melophagium]|uniref:uncharacterized protein n=1 Tax=Trypanosoma melophagium TaxID=715481 RepID=UPI00351A5DFA|nr:hypothetical protein LSM04_002439 [Trypanosoma melophagium]